jgi:hypothetical protein
MSIGSGIVLIVIGAVLAFAINVSPAWIDLHTVGGILIGAGIVVLVFGIIGMTRKRETIETVRVIADPASGDQVTQRKTSNNL